MNESPVRIFVADLRPEVAENIAAVLRARGFLVQVACQEATMLQEARAFRPDAALIDLGADGRATYEMARTFRNTPELSGLYLMTMADAGAAMSPSMNKVPVDAHLVTPGAYRMIASTLFARFADAGTAPMQ